MMEPKKLTPMLKQYFEIKKQYEDAILFFRMGDFYEMFFDDAKIAAPVLEVVLTARDKKKENSVPLCGIPYHARDNYAAKLLNKGYKVAICEQVEDPSAAQGIVKRAVTKILTPGTAVELDNNSDISNYAVSVYEDEGSISVASIDLSAADFEVRSFPGENEDAMISELYRKFPKEIVINRSFAEKWSRICAVHYVLADITVTEYEDYDCNYYENEEFLKNHFRIESIEGLGIKDYPSAVICAGIILKYIKKLRKSFLNNLTELRFVPEEKTMVLDSVSFTNLEILKNLKTGTKKGSLFSALDKTVTPMGKRLLQQRLSYPLIVKEEINRRLDAVEEFSNSLIVRTELRKILRQLSDLARLNTKISLNIAMPSHLLLLKDILKCIPDIKNQIEELKSELITEIRDSINPLKNIADMIEQSISEDPSNNLSDGNYIKEGFCGELDELRDISRNAKHVISAMEKEEREKTGITTLKVKYNRVFGYFIEVTKANLGSVPEDYIRKQTLVNSERFITAQLKELEEKILKSEEKSLVIERRIYQETLDSINEFTHELNENSRMIAELDVFAGAGEIAASRSYVRPGISDSSSISITEGKHPVVEMSMNSGFIPNDTRLSSSSDQILIITGPNMGGKSTYLRQNALIVLMAQAGFFVPAAKANIGICDRIFTRIGASDSLIEGKSTFLVEMIETALILNNATKNSLILLDEIGRGTSTFDGLSIAWAVIEYLHEIKEKPKTLFATHYHELTELADIKERVINYHISVKEWQDKVVFLHKIVPGATDQSFGIHVAKIAGVPAAVIERAKDVLLNLEKKEINRLVSERLRGDIHKIPEKSDKLFPQEAELKAWDEIRENLKSVDISNITPLEALNTLHFLKYKMETFE